MLLHLASALMALLAAGSVAARPACNLALVFALDVSASVDAREYRLQAEGLARALTSPVIARTLLDQAAAPVAFAAFEWSGPGAQAPILDWILIDTPESLDRAARAITAHPRSVAPGPTAIGAAIGAAGGLFARGPDCARRTIDISGDGKNNAGPEPRAAGAALGDVTINALVIGGDLIMDHAPYIPGDGVLSGWFRDAVIQGPGAFVEIADGYEDYEPAMLRKLIRELGVLVVSGAE